MWLQDFLQKKNGQLVAHVGYLVGDGRKPFVLPPKDSCRFGEPPVRGAGAEGMSASEPASYSARDGYMLALCAEQEKGMSGGPTTDARGRVIGLSGRHKPLWSSDDDFSKNGNTQMSREEFAVLEQFTWAIPISLWGLSGSTGDRPWEPLW